MKKWLICLLALLLLLPSALAETKLESTVELPRTIDLAYSTNCYVSRVDQGGYQIFDANGNPLSDVYRILYIKNSGMYYEYTVGGLNGIGLLDRDGQVLAEPSYGKTYAINDDWMLAYVLEPTTNDNGDFRDQDSNFYMVTRTDVYYDFKLIGSLTREEFSPSLKYSYTGKYLYVKLTSDSGYYIDRHFNITRVEKGFTTSEFTDDGKKGVLHNPSNQRAYIDSCTLTDEDVTKPVWYNAKANALVDLQGNVIKSDVTYDRVSSRGEYLEIRDEGKYGVMDRYGNVIIEPLYSKPSIYLFHGDYQAMLTEEGHLHYYDKQGNLTAKAELGLTMNDYTGAYDGASFATVKNLGKVMVITATKGVLPEMYEAAGKAKPGQKILTVQKNGLWGAIDLNGNVVLPFIHRDSLTISNDSTLVYGTDEYRTYYLYRLSYVEDAPVVAADPIAETESVVATESAAPADGWTCSCGTINTGKFCAECGSAKPVAEPQCPGCGYKPEGAAPKFCPECGTKF